MRLIFLFFFFIINTSFALTLDSAKKFALLNNKNIKISSLNIQEKFGEVRSNEGIYDLDFFASFNYKDSKIPSTSAFASNDIINETISSYSIGFESYLPTGTSFRINAFDLVKTESDLGTNSMSPSWKSSSSLFVTQNLFRNFGSDINSSFIFVAQNNKEISKIALEKTISETLVNVESKFYSALLAKKKVDVSSSSLFLAEDLVIKNSIQVEAGTLPKIALLQAKAAVAFRQVELIKSQNEYDNALDELKVSISMPLKTKIVLEGSIEPKIEKVNDFDKIEEIALNNRPEIKQRNLRIKSASRLVDYYKNQMLPDFNLQASIGYSGLGGSKSDDYSTSILGPPSIDSKYDDGFSDSISNLRSGDNFDWSIGASLIIPLGNDDAKGKLQSNEANKAREIILLEQLLDQVALEARSSWRDVASNLRNIDSTKIAFELQKEILENEQERFNIGLSKTNDVLEAQKELEQAELIYNKAIAEYNLSLSKYKFSLGTLIKDNKIILDD